MWWMSLTLSPHGLTMRRGLGEVVNTTQSILYVPVAAGRVVNGSIFLIVPIPGGHHHSLHLVVRDVVQVLENMKSCFTSIIFTSNTISLCPNLHEHVEPCSNQCQVFVPRIAVSLMEV